MISKICIIGTSNLKHISLISLYTNYFDAKNIPYDIIYLDRYGIEEECSAVHVYKYAAKATKGKFSKFVTFLRFRNFVINKIIKNKYEYLITWQTTGAYLFCDILLRKFKNRYVINVRDYIIEKNIVFYSILTRLIKNSAFTTISSEGFKSFLPKHDYVKVNSINEDMLQSVKGIPQNKQDVIKIGFAGNCRYFRESFKLIDSLGNDSRFELWYCGTNSEVLAKYAEAKGYENVKTISGFAPSDTVKIMSSFDLVNSAFGNDAMDNSTLMPIRLYTALAIHRPMLVNNSTQLGKEISENQIGFEISSYVGLADAIYQYYKNLNFDMFSENADKYIKNARKENKLFYDALSKLRK